LLVAKNKSKVAPGNSGAAFWLFPTAGDLPHCAGKMVGDSAVANQKTQLDDTAVVYIESTSDTAVASKTK